MPKVVTSKKNLEIRLQKLEKLNSYNNSLEQYPTDASLASEILFLAVLDGNIEGKIVGDFGAGNGILGIGAALLGSEKVYCVEVDHQATEVIHRNSGGLNVEVLEMNISSFKENVDTVVMNPPFGSVVKGSDRKFLEKAVNLSKKVYSIHNARSADFVRNFYVEYGEITREVKVKIRTPRIYSHHSSDMDVIEGIFFSVNVN